VSSGRSRAGRSWVIAATILIPGILSGCVQTFDTAALGVPVTMASPAGQPTEGTPFKVTAHSVFAFWGLTRIKEPSLRKALAAQLVGGGGVADLRIKVRSRFPDVLATIFTAGLLIPRSVTYEGVVTK
jgi:hypothetical protein